MNKPVAWMSELGTCYSLEDIAEMPKNIADNFTIPLYTHPVKELTNEVYFCSRCGKRLGDGIHTCTPPADILREAQ